MTEIQVSTQLDGSTPLWRYMSLDKLVDLLSTSELFFTPLASFVKSDPYEGYLPAVCMDADASMHRQIVRDVEFTFSGVEEHRQSVGHELTEEERALLSGKLNDLKTVSRRFIAASTKRMAVNCWHINNGESEAMWRLYGDDGKGVAVETTLDALRESIRACESAHRVHVYPVKYLDFFDSNLSPKDCVVEGKFRAPFLKRLSYEHEREVRAYIGRFPDTERDAADIEYSKPAPVRLPVELKRLVKAVHVSPYPGEPFPSSVTKVCEVWGLPKGTVQRSRLLSGHEELLDRLLP